MGAPQDTYKYQYIGPNDRIKHSGITNDLDRRESELRRKYGPGHIEKVGNRTAHEGAKEWERDKPTAAAQIRRLPSPATTLVRMLEPR